VKPYVQCKMFEISINIDIAIYGTYNIETLVINVGYDIVGNVKLVK